MEEETNELTDDRTNERKKTEREKRKKQRFFSKTMYNDRTKEVRERKEWLNGSNERRQIMPITPPQPQYWGKKKKIIRNCNAYRVK